MQQRSEGLLQAGDWEVPAEDAACPTLNSAAALKGQGRQQKQHCRSPQTEHFPFSPAQPEVSAPHTQHSCPLPNPWHQGERRKRKHCAGTQAGVTWELDS